MRLPHPKHTELINHVRVFADINCSRAPKSFSMHVVFMELLFIVVLTLQLLAACHSQPDCGKERYRYRVCI